jgi:hypothetical protein
MARTVLLVMASLTLSSCGVIVDALVDSAFESSSDRKIRKDTGRMQAGEPLKQFPSERRLRLAREDRMLDDLQTR